MKGMTRKLKKGGLVLLFVLVYFTPDFKFLPFYTWCLAALGGVLLISVSVRKKLCFGCADNKNFLILLFSVLFALGIIVPLSHTTFDFSYIPIILGIILCLFRNFLVVYIIKRKNKAERAVHEFLDTFLYACCICVLFTLLFIAFPDFKEVWLNNVIVNNVSEEHAAWAAYEFRYSIGGFAAYAYATLFSFAIIMAAYFICATGTTPKNIARFALVCIGGFFYGRITVFAIAIGLLMILLERKNLLKAINLILIMGIGVAILLALLNHLSAQDPRFEVWSNWAFAFLEDIFVNKEIKTHSVSFMLDTMYFLPNPTTLLFGDGLYTDPVTGSYYMTTDVGYMRMILYGGILATIVAYMPAIYLLRKLAKNTPDKRFKKFIFAIFLVWLILEAKGESYHRLILVLYPILLLNLRSKKHGPFN